MHNYNNYYNYFFAVSRIRAQTLQPQFTTTSKVPLKHELSRTPKPSLIPIKTPPSVKTKTGSPKQSRIPRPVHTSPPVGNVKTVTSPRIHLKSPSNSSGITPVASPKTGSKLKVVTPSPSPQAQKKMISTESGSQSEKFTLDRKKKVSEISSKDKTKQVVGEEQTVTATEPISFQDEVICNPESLFETISKDICNWKMVGRYLLIHDKDIDKMAADRFRTNQDRALNMLQVWRHRVSQSGRQVTYKELSSALHNSLNDELLLKLKEHYSRNSTRIASESVSSPANDQLSIHVPLNEFWETLEPFIENKLSKGYRNVTIVLKFDK